MNFAYRWFLGLKFKDPVPHHSTISWNRQHRFKNTDIFQEIFDEIVLQAMNHNMVGGRVLVVTRHVWEEYKEKVRINRLSLSKNAL